MSDILTFDAAVQIEASAGDQKQPRVSIVAYSGGAMRPPGWGWVAIDLAGLAFGPQVPLLADHQNSLGAIVGHAVPRVQGQQLVASGNLIPGSEAADRIIELARGGLQFSASVGVEPLKQDRVAAGIDVTVNGKTLTSADGLTIVRAGRLREISILAAGADPTASVTVSASLGRESAMANENEKSFDPTVQAAWENPALSPSEQIMARFDAVNFTDAGIRQECAGHLHAAMSGKITLADLDRMLLRAELRDGRLKAMRDERPQAPAAHIGSQISPTEQVLEGAFLARMGREDLGVKTLGEATMEQARGLRATHILDLVKASLTMAGRPVPASKDQMIRAAFSTHTITTMLTNAGNKMLLDAFTAFPSVARMIARKLNANDFKTHTGFRLTGDVGFEQVGAAGEIHHGTLGQSAFSFKVDTYARMLSLTRQDIINDDLGAFDTIPAMIGRGAASKLESTFWAFVLANSGSFFAGGNGNYISGGTSVLGITGLGKAVEAIRKMVDSAGEPIVVQPAFLVVPPELEALADQLFTSTNLLVVPDAASNATSTTPDGNPYRAKYQPLVVPHLSNDSYTNNSSTGWYLFGRPSDVAAFGVAYLNNVEAPTIETAEADFSTLGMQFRGYLDFGVCQIDSKGGVMSAGA